MNKGHSNDYDLDASQGGAASALLGIQEEALEENAAENNNFDMAELDDRLQRHDYYADELEKIKRMIEWGQ